jgi:hypothetical protein
MGYLHCREMSSDPFREKEVLTTLEWLQEQGNYHVIETRQAVDLLPFRYLPGTSREDTTYSTPAGIRVPIMHQQRMLRKFGPPRNNSRQ